MVNLSYPHKRKLQIYLIAALLAILCCILVACNSDNSYSVAGENVSEPTHFMAKFMITINNALGDGVASFGWTVVLFTVILRLILSPLDIWQKVISRRNNKAMERMKPQLEALQARYADDKQRLQQEQMALYKKEKYSTMGMCLPTIVTFVVFFVVFAGFRQMVGYQFAKDYKECVKAYNTSIAEQIEANKDADYIVDNGDGKWDIDDVAKTESGADFYAAAKKNAQHAVYNVYYSEDQVTIRSFLWIKNIFVSDNWAQAVPDFATVTGQKGMATSKLTGITIDEYNDVMADVLGTGGYGKDGKWNGLLILPILSIALSFLSTKLLSGSQAQPPAPPQDAQGEGAEKAQSQQQTMKMMQYVMPIMMGVFALFYSGAFALYMFTSSLCAILFQLTFNLIAKLVDKSREGASGVAKR
ncbi:membrane protein insertase YidC/Oxa1 family [Firmicutes bacterium CAG:475]|nr:membrane protein insertase YidC/Oxa1 family [Firmicutes bacterium CAG:475]